MWSSLLCVLLYFSLSTSHCVIYIYNELQAVPELCSLGYQSDIGQVQCSPCPAGYRCPSSSDPSLNAPCSPGYYSIEGDANCNPCQAGSYCPNATIGQGFPCSRGTYSEGSAVFCSPCPLGWKCPFLDGHGNTECPMVWWFIEP